MNSTMTLEAPFWPERISVVSIATFPQEFVTVEARGLSSGRHYTTTLPAERWAELRQDTPTAPTFASNPTEFKLAFEAERLALAHTCDPLLAANNSRVDVLPHQVEAVYGAMLPQPTIRHLMAHDAGAGKTIMAGLLFKELRLREPGLRTLIVAPAALTVQWQRELEEKFFERFAIVGREELRSDPSVWGKTPQAITSVDFARQSDVQASLAHVSWGLVIVDEAHHLAGYEKHVTLAYRLGELLARQSRHLVLATATPHKGDAANFLRLLQLLDSGIHSPSIVVEKPAGQRGSPLMLRRLKEEMVTLDGERLFKPRIVKTRCHRIEDNPPELALYTALTDYVDKTYRAAERIGGRERVNVRFAMTMLQRRMASSFAALEVSLGRRRESLRHSTSDVGTVGVPEYLNELAEADRWDAEQRLELSTPARTRHERDKEAAQIGLLLDKLETIRRTGVETKVEALGKVLAEAGIAPGNGEKLLVFTEFKDTLNWLRELFSKRGYSTTQIDGSMNHDLRRRAEREFRDRVQVMVATEAAGEGINLQFCARMVNYDLPWVPTRLEQRMGRIHRYGQKREARIYNLAAADTREGQVLVGLMDRLDTMRTHLGDQVFDVVSALVSDVDVEKLLSDVALAPPAESSQAEALRRLLEAIEAGEKRYGEVEEHPFAIDAEQLQRMQAVSRELRLTPDYAQHFLVDALEHLNEKPVAAGPGIGRVPPGDADVVQVHLTRPSVAKALGVDSGRTLRLTFSQEMAKQHPNAEFVALGTPIVDGAVSMARQRWGGTLPVGAVFIDPELAPGSEYLLWFVSANVVDGNGTTVAQKLLAIRQTPESMTSAPASALVDLVPRSGSPTVPQVLLGLGRDASPAIEWSIEHQQLPFLREAEVCRAAVVALRRQPILSDAQAALDAAQRAYDDSVFGGDDSADEAEREVDKTKQRLTEQRKNFEREAACSLGFTDTVGVVAVVAAEGGPTEDLSDRRPEIAAAAVKKAREYEAAHGRSVLDVSGEHRDYPYDLHSRGPGGVRCIEVKGTTTGRITLSENERRAAQRFGSSYYLYVVIDPLATARLSILRDPLAKMTHDATLHSGVRYAYNSSTWRACVDEESTL